MKVMLLTSGDRVGDFDRCDRLGVARYMTKPIKQSELLDAIGAAFHVVPMTMPHEQVDADDVDHVRGLRILLAEDSVPNQKLALGLLKKFNHDVTVAGDGLQALKMWQTGIFDVILMDVQMPELDGLEATRQIRQRQDQAGHTIPIIAMTAHAMKGDEELCLQAGMDAYVAKPIRPEDLYAAIDRTCGTLSSPPTPSEAMTNSDKTPVGCRVDWEKALGVVQEDQDLLGEVIEAVLEEIPRLIDELETALKQQDQKTIQRLGHTVKGNLRTFDAQPGLATAEALEKYARDGELDRAAALYEQLVRETTEFTTELSESPYAKPAET
jgi:CheY-like chemotaxis protein